MRNAPLKFQPFPADGINAGSEGKPAPTNLSTSLTLAAMSLGYGVVQLDVTIVNTAACGGGGGNPAPHFKLRVTLIGEGSIGSRASSGPAQCKARAAKCHQRAERQRRKTREHAGYGRDRAWRRSGLSRAGQHQHADRDQELPHPLWNLPRHRAVHQCRGEITP